MAKTHSIRTQRRRPERQVTAIKRDEAVRTLLEQGQFKAVRSGFFCLADHQIPVAGTERPKPCPFCGKLDDVRVVIVENSGAGRSAYVECGVCGAEAPRASTEEDDISEVYEAILHATRRWNRRGGEPW